MADQNEKVISQNRSQMEKAEKIRRIRHLNPFVRKGQIVFAGSSLMEQFPIYEFLQDFQLPYTIYNRGIGGFTTTEMKQCLQEMIFDLEPRYLFLNIGTNDLNGPDYILKEMIGRYDGILKAIKEKLPEIRIFLLAYYPVNPKAAANPIMESVFHYRTNERICEANEAVEQLAKRHGAEFLNLNSGITDEEGNLKAEYAIDGMHMYANGYRQVMEQLLPVLSKL